MTHILPRIRPSILQLLALFGLLLLASVVPPGVWSQTPDRLAPLPSGTRANPFSGFETHYLSNGLNIGLSEDENQELLGDSYDPDPDEKF